MRAYKYLDRWVDLDHVLAVSEYGTNLNTKVPDVYIWMAFRDAPLTIYFDNQYGLETAAYNDPRTACLSVFEERSMVAKVVKHELFRAEYDKFMAAWRGEK